MLIETATKLRETLGDGLFADHNIFLQKIEAALKEAEEALKSTAAGTPDVSTTTLAPALTPHGHLVLAPVDDAPALPADLSRRIEQSFAHGSGHGMLQLGAAEVDTALPPALAYWRDFGARVAKYEVLNGGQPVDTGVNVAEPIVEPAAAQATQRWNLCVPLQVTEQAPAMAFGMNDEFLVAFCSFRSPGLCQLEIIDGTLREYVEPSGEM